MKGLTHFMTGLAAASFFPGAVQAAADGNPLYFILGGAFGIMPDTMDFRFGRFFARHDMEVVPDPNRPDPQMIAGAVAHAVNRAHLGGRPVRIRLNTVPLGADAWQQYTVRFDVAGNRVLAEYGPAVDTGRMPIPGADPGRRRRRAEAPLACPVVLDYEAENTVDIFDGPLFRMTPTGDGRVRPEFIPWHRAWSHSFAVAAAAAAACWLLLGPLAGAVAGAAYCAHILADQLGFMGANLLFPFRRNRSAGLGVMHSDETLPNFLAVWFSCLLIFWNLRATAAAPIPSFNLLQLLLYAGILPVCACVLIGRALRRKPKHEPG